MDRASVWLNSIMYGTAACLAEMYDKIGETEYASGWSTTAENLQSLINKKLWNKNGFYDPNNKTRERRQDYLHASSCFAPLTFGLATQEQADKIVEQLFPALMCPRGLLTSNVESGHQWDKPYGWVPLQYLTVLGLLRYKKQTEAEAIIAANLLHLSEANGVCLEKINLLAENFMDVHNISGYAENVQDIGFAVSVLINFYQLAKALDTNMDDLERYVSGYYPAKLEEPIRMV